MNDTLVEETTPLLSVPDVADLCKVQVGTVYTWVSRRLIPHVKLGPLVRFRREDIEQYLAEHVVAPVR